MSLVLISYSLSCRNPSNAQPNSFYISKDLADEKVVSLRTETGGWFQCEVVNEAGKETSLVHVIPSSKTSTSRPITCELNAE